jgi:hypothetical protein
MRRKPNQDLRRVGAAVDLVNSTDFVGCLNMKKSEAGHAGHREVAFISPSHAPRYFPQKRRGVFMTKVIFPIFFGLGFP